MTENNWSVRPEKHGDEAAIRAVEMAAFPSAEEADLVDALRRDPTAWIDGLSYVAVVDGDVIGHALLTRAEIDGEPVLALAPCAVVPSAQGTGVGTSVITALLDAAREAGETTAVVLGHADYYPRFGFRPASGFGVTAPFDVPDDAFLVLPLAPDTVPPSGLMRYAAAFGV
ncbi:GNAT family N-acetyltransferase [Gordonia neofelifaecis]|uniref:Acetyltransferase n=1 Tax=Gordonia neofelifaecis NRRL B-59395 TaxID=644548 RepID=F1YGV1_9ACTN|nr:N-acetyltransferase [Gordonia neofelifaecis]EGD56249.1 acetyltransferase [Gordonia neofelifaecis NRRL B-59395]